jgi:hypothetical protein
MGASDPLAAVALLGFTIDVAKVEIMLMSVHGLAGVILINGEVDNDATL